MNTHISRSSNSRLRLDPNAAAYAGKVEAAGLLVAIASLSADDNPGDLLNETLGEIISLASDHREEECRARLAAFCEVIGPELERAAALKSNCAVFSASLNQANRVVQTTSVEQRVVDAAIATCSQVSDGRIIAAHQNDDDAIVTLCELQLAVRALEPSFTETEGGEL